MNQIEIEDFKAILEDLSPINFSYDFNGKPHVIVKNWYAAVGLCLQSKDINLLLKLIDEALAANELFGILYQSNHE